MNKHVRQNAVAYLALIVAVIGVPTAWAVGKNTIGSAQIKKAAIKKSDIAKNAINSSKVKDGSLVDDDFAAGQLPAGPKGEPGEKGDPGAPGQDGSPDTPAQVLTKLAGVDGAGSGLDADTVDGGVEDPHIVGALGEPPFLEANPGAFWTASAPAPSFYRDPFGVVRLAGRATVPAGFANGTTPIFQLPAGYRPVDSASFAVATAGANPENPAAAIVLSSGNVGIFDTPGGDTLSAGEVVALDGISFRCNPNAGGGCPDS